MRNNSPRVPAVIQLLQVIPALQAPPATLLGLGIRREHVQSRMGRNKHRQHRPKSAAQRPIFDVQVRTGRFLKGYDQFTSSFGGHTKVRDRQKRSLQSIKINPDAAINMAVVPPKS